MELCTSRSLSNPNLFSKNTSGFRFNPSIPLKKRIQFLGKIPHELGNLTNIQSINMSHNHLWGDISKSFSNLTQIESLDLSYNSLSGRIPTELTALNFLGTFRVMYNNLFGKIPFESQFSTFNESDYEGVLSHTSTLLRASSDDTSSSQTSKFSWDTSDPVATLEDVPSTLDKVPPVKQSVFNETEEPEPSKDESPPNETVQSINEFLEKFNIKLDLEDPYPILLYGGGALVALWLLSAVVGAIDSIPVFPKLMEIVGLGYSLWFTTRYLLFKKNREELLSKVDELKEDVLGSSDK